MVLEKKEVELKLYMDKYELAKRKIKENNTKAKDMVNSRLKQENEKFVKEKTIIMNDIKKRYVPKKEHSSMKNEMESMNKKYGELVKVFGNTK